MCKWWCDASRHVYLGRPRECTNGLDSGNSIKYRCTNNERL
jgi:hypothetical protein